MSAESGAELRLRANGAGENNANPTSPASLASAARPARPAPPGEFKSPLDKRYVVRTKKNKTKKQHQNLRIPNLQT